VIGFLSESLMSSILASLSMSLDTVPSPIEFSETAQSLEQKFQDCRVIRGSISSNRLNPEFLPLILKGEIKRGFASIFLLDSVRPVGLYNLQPRSRTASLSSRFQRDSTTRLCSSASRHAKRDGMLASALGLHSLQLDAIERIRTRFTHFGRLRCPPIRGLRMRGCVSTIVFSVLTC
jgi:hypothetical protein